MSWPKLMDVSEYQKEAYIGSKIPSLKTLKTKIRNRVIPGEIQGKRYFVLVGPDGALMWRNDPQKAESPSSTEEQADNMIDRWLEEANRREHPTS